MTNELQQTRYDRLMRRVGGIIGPGSKVSEVLTELFPTLDVENVPGELLFLSGWQLGMGGGIITSGAGNTPRYQVVNPPGSGKIVVVTKMVVSNIASAGSTRMITTDTLFVSNPGTAMKRDTREGVGQTVTEVRTDILGPGTSPNFVWRNTANVNFVLEDENGIAVLSPGFALEVGLNINAATFNAGFFWRERVAEAAELAFS